MALWVFGYGSLIWDPGFAPAERLVARLDGWRRSFCMWSIHYRGTSARPGLVLALDRDDGGSCTGVALRLPQASEVEILSQLRARELVSSAYREASCPVRLADGRTVEATTYVVDRAHAQYCGGLPLERQAEIIAAAAGNRGRNDDYLFRTVAQLAALGLQDVELDELASRVRELNAGVVAGSR